MLLTTAPLLDMKCTHYHLKYHEIAGVMYMQMRCPDCDMRFDTRSITNEEEKCSTWCAPKCVVDPCLCSCHKKNEEESLSCKIRDLVKLNEVQQKEEKEFRKELLCMLGNRYIAQHGFTTGLFDKEDIADLRKKYL